MRIILLSLLLLCAHNYIFSQAVIGSLVNENQEALQEAHIFNRATGDHTHSNELGQFKLENCSLGDTLQISYIGYLIELYVLKDISRPLTIVLHRIVFSLDEILVSPKMDALNIFTDVDVLTNPVNSSQEVMRRVPGLFIGQHAGGGKAEQIFLRGFDIDHGTDIHLSVDGLPVNMVSHAHGQGYADLHFVIPETLSNIDFGKGPYYDDIGNFGTAGYVAFSTHQKLENSSIKLEAGQFNTYRLLSMFNLLESDKNNAYIASEYMSTDGYFVSPQNFNRLNLYGRYSGHVNGKDRVGVIASYFDSKWDASGQVPLRAVVSGLITRFGSIDDTEGGSTSRSNLLVSYDKIIDESSSIKSKMYMSQYDFELYSNFTFFLQDSINGDQIRQKENRIIYGLNTDYSKSYTKGNITVNWRAGVSLRTDRTRNTELSHTLDRATILETNNLGDINETHVGMYVGAETDINKWTIIPSMRLDYLEFQYADKLSSSSITNAQANTIGSPKLNVLYRPTRQIQLYLKTGKGFHSNDTRVVLAEKGKEILPAAYGYDLGYIWKPSPRIFLNMAYWYLYLEQEFVYVGDAGIIEPSGKTKRRGVDISCRYQALDWLFCNLDVNYSYARSSDEPEGEDYIPLAPDFTWAGGLDVLFESGLYGSLNIRHIANRPATEDNSIIAEGYTISDMNLGYRWPTISTGIQVQNLFNAEWKETQFSTESRLQNEIESTEEIHFTPGTPFLAKGMIQFSF